MMKFPVMRAAFDAYTWVLGRPAALIRPVLIPTLLMALSLAAVHWFYLHDGETWGLTFLLPAFAFFCFAAVGWGEYILHEESSLSGMGFSRRGVQLMPAALLLFVLTAIGPLVLMRALALSLVLGSSLAYVAFPLAGLAIWFGTFLAVRLMPMIGWIVHDGTWHMRNTLKATKGHFSGLFMLFILVLSPLAFAAVETFSVEMGTPVIGVSLSVVVETVFGMLAVAASTVAYRYLIWRDEKVLEVLAKDGYVDEGDTKEDHLEEESPKGFL